LNHWKIMRKLSLRLVTLPRLPEKDAPIFEKI